MKKFALYSTIFGLLTTSSYAALNLSFTFDHSATNHGVLRNDAWSGTTTNATKQDAFENAIRQAGQRWEYAFLASTVDLTFNIAVSWEDKGGDTLATGGPSISSAPGNPIISGSLKWDSDGTSTFYTDLDTTNDTEWTKNSIRSMDFGAGNINVERVSYNAPAGAVRDNSDLFTVAVHEIGHALGIVNGYSKYNNLDTGNDGDLDLSDGSQVPYSGGHTDFQIGTPEYVDGSSFFYPYSGSSVGATYGPNIIGPSIVKGVRKGLTEVDIRIVEDIHGFDNVNYLPAPVPEPSSTLLLGLGSFALIMRRRK